MRTTVFVRANHSFPISFEVLDLGGIPCVFLSMKMPREIAKLAEAYAAIERASGRRFTYVLMDNADDGDNPTTPVSDAIALTATLLRVLSDGRLMEAVPETEEAQLLVKHKARIKKASINCRQELAGA